VAHIAFALVFFAASSVTVSFVLDHNAFVLVAASLDFCLDSVLPQGCQRKSK
jgi:hypothetical protein